MIGGGLDEDITGGTHVEIYTSLPLTYVYGGGVNGSVESNVYLHIENCGKIQHVRAGGYANKKDAKVNGNITLDFINSVTDNPIYGRRICAVVLFSGGYWFNLHKSVRTK